MFSRRWDTRCRRQQEHALGKKGQGRDAGDGLLQEQKGHRAMAKRKDNDKSDVGRQRR